MIRMKRRGIDGGMQSDAPIALALQARLKMETVYKDGHHRKMGGAASKIATAKALDAGYGTVEVRYVLMDYSAGNKQLKSKMMTRLEAYNRNETLRGLGMAWAMCGQ